MGLTQPFSVYRSGDPFVLREFSEKLHQLGQNEFGRNPELFPQDKDSRGGTRGSLTKNIFGRFGLKTSSEKLQKQFVSEQTRARKKAFRTWSGPQGT